MKRSLWVALVAALALVLLVANVGFAQDATPTPVPAAGQGYGPLGMVPGGMMSGGTMPGGMMRGGMMSGDMMSGGTMPGGTMRGGMMHGGMMQGMMSGTGFGNLMGCHGRLSEDAIGVWDPMQQSQTAPETTLESAPLSN